MTQMDAVSVGELGLSKAELLRAHNSFKDLTEIHGINIFPEYQAVKYKPTKKEAMLRITDPLWPLPPLKYESFFSAIACFTFHDVESPKHGRIMLKSEGVEIVKFFEANRDVEVMNFHCAAGISRSSGAAIAWARFKKDARAEELIWENRLLSPNKLVIETIGAAS